MSHCSLLVFEAYFTITQCYQKLQTRTWFSIEAVKSSEIVYASVFSHKKYSFLYDTIQWVDVATMRNLHQLVVVYPPLNFRTKTDCPLEEIFSGDVLPYLHADWILSIEVNVGTINELS